MKKSVFLFFVVTLFSCQKQDLQNLKPRVIIMTDMTHDDGNSLIRYLYYSHMFDLEALIVTQQLPDYNHNDDGPWQKAQNILNAYKQEEAQLKKHEPGLPAYEELAKVTKKGRGALPILWLNDTETFAGNIADRYVESSWNKPVFSDFIGEGTTPNGEPKDSEGSEFLQEVFAKDDDRPIFVQMWGGPITFVQALYRYRQRQGEEKFQQLLDKLFIYSIHLQDITFDYFVNLDSIRKEGCLNMGTTSSSYNGERVTPKWFVYDHGHFWKYIKVMKHEEVNGHGPMSNLYDGGGEGDTPAFLYLISSQLGLNDPLDATQGSWGNMFYSMGESFPENYFSTCKGSNEELYKWIPDTRNSFLNRLQWSIKEPNEVNHEPKVVVNKDGSNKIMRFKVKPGDKIELDASRSNDPDGDDIEFNWQYYQKAGTYKGEVKVDVENKSKATIIVPEDIGTNNIHILLEVRDKGAPSLVAYKRVILSVEE